MVTNDQNELFHVSGGRKFQIKVSAGSRSLCPSLPLPASGGSRRPLACGHILPISAPDFMWPFPLYLCVFFLVSYKDTHPRCRAPHNPRSSHLSILILRTPASLYSKLGHILRILRGKGETPFNPPVPNPLCSSYLLPCDKPS